MTILRAQPYLFFNGRCAEALAFYEKTLGAKTEYVLKFKDNPDKPPPEKVPRTLDDKIMHCSFRIGETELMASDGMEDGAPAFRGISLTLSVKSPKEADRIFRALEKGGKVEMPLAKTFFSPRFGAVTDKFGVSWMVVTEPAA